MGRTEGSSIHSGLIIIFVFPKIGRLFFRKYDDEVMQFVFVLALVFLGGGLISLAGLAAGLLLGTAAAIVQQHCGLIKMPQGFMISAYPCMLETGDVLMTAAGVALTGFLISLLASGGKH